MTTERNHTFDFLCGIAILRMLLNHITSMCGLGRMEWWQSVYFWSYFLLCFFFFKSGYFNKSLRGDTGQFLLGKAGALLVPYVTWGAIGCANFWLMASLAQLRYHHYIETVTPDHIWLTSGVVGNAPLWFLMSFFVTYVVMRFVSRCRWLQPLTVLLPVVSWWLYTNGNPLWLSLNNIFMCIFLFQLGHWWRQLSARLGRGWLFVLSAVLLGLFAALNVLCHGEYNVSQNLWQGNPLVVCLLLSLVLCGLSGVLLAARLPRVPIINYVGQHSMVYFVAHYPMLVFYRYVHIIFGHSLQGRWDDFILLLIVVPIVCSWLVPYVERVPWLSGRFPDDYLQRLSARCRRLTGKSLC